MTKYTTMTFVLRQAHEDAFSAASYLRFQKRAMSTLRERYAKNLENISDDDLLITVRRRCEQARQYGFTTERQIVRFLECTVLFEDDLEPQSPYKHIIYMLSNAKERPEERSLGALSFAKSVIPISEN